MKKNIRIIMFFLIVLCMIFFVISSSSVSIFGYRAYTALSGSMKNKINVYDIVISKKVPIEELKVGDIITFEAGNGVVTHRIVGTIGDKYITKGDNNNTEDEDKVSYSKVKGKVVFIVPKLGRIILFFKSKTGLVILFSIVFVFYFIDAWVLRHENE